MSFCRGQGEKARRGIGGKCVVLKRSMSWIVVSGGEGWEEAGRLFGRLKESAD